MHLSVKEGRRGGTIVFFAVCKNMKICLSLATLRCVGTQGTLGIVKAWRGSRSLYYYNDSPNTNAGSKGKRASHQTQPAESTRMLLTPPLIQSLHAYQPPVTPCFLTPMSRSIDNSNSFCTIKIHQHMGPWAVPSANHIAPLSTHACACMPSHTLHKTSL